MILHPVKNLTSHSADFIMLINKAMVWKWIKAFVYLSMCVTSALGKFDLVQYHIEYIFNCSNHIE